MTTVAPPSARRAIGALIWFFWRSNRAAFLAVAVVWLVFAILAQALGSFFASDEGGMMWIHVPFGLSLFFIMGYSHFTDSGRRLRFAAFPVHLFTLPTSSRLLATGPMLGAVMVLLVAYIAWAKGVYRPLGISLPLGWPTLYLGVAMVCFQSVIWALGEHRFLRVVALGIGGTLLPIAWNLFRDEAGQVLANYEVFGWEIPVAHTGLLLFWATLGVVAYGIALRAIARQRTGHCAKRIDFLAIIEGAARLISTKTPCFGSSAQALRWSEWQRLACGLPFMIGTLLFLVFGISIFYRPLQFETGAFTLCWVMVAPVGLAWAMGQGFGLIGPLSKEVTFLPFYAVRPVADGDWTVVKMQTALKSALVAWGLVALVVPIWMVTCCDYWPILDFFRIISLHDTLPHLLTVAAFLVAGLVLFTWRLLVGNLYVGLLGNPILMNVSVCGMLAFGLGSLFFGVWRASLNPSLGDFLDWPSWVPWALGAVFAAKAGVAAWFARLGLQAGSITLRRVALYAVIWLLGTAVFLELVWLLFPVSTGFTRALSALALFCMPMLRLSLAPLATTANRRGGWRFLMARLAYTSIPGAPSARSFRLPLGTILLAMGAFLAGAFFTNQLHRKNEVEATVPPVTVDSATPKLPEAVLPDPRPAAQTTQDQIEIARLRGKVAELRVQLDASRQLVLHVPPGSNMTLREIAPTRQALATYPSSGWMDSGFGTAYDALQTHWWAVRSGDVAKFKASVLISDSLRASLDKSFPEELRFGRSIEEGFMMPAQALDRSRGINSYSVLDQKVVSSNEIDLEVETLYKSGDAERQLWKFVRVNGQWRQLIDEEFVGLPKP